MKTIVTALLFVLISAPAIAGDFWESSVFSFGFEPVPPGHTLQRVMQLTSDRDDAVTYLSVMTDEEQHVAGFYGSNTASFFQFNEDPSASRNVFWLREIESSAGAVLAEVQGKKALILKGKLDRRTQEGRFVIRYLSNGLFNSYKSCDLLLRQRDNAWFIQNAYTNRPVSRAKVITHSLGISTIEGICPE